MKRGLLKALTVTSLALCVATLTLWLRSYWRSDEAYYLQNQKDQDVLSEASPRDNQALHFITRAGHIRIGYEWGGHLKAESSLVPEGVSIHSIRRDDDAWLLDDTQYTYEASQAGIRYMYDETGANYARIVDLPFIYPLAIFSAIPLISLWKLLKLKAPRPRVPTSRRISNAAFVLSIAICALAWIMRARSYWRNDEINWRQERRFEASHYEVTGEKPPSGLNRNLNVMTGPGGIQDVFEWGDVLSGEHDLVPDGLWIHSTVVYSLGGSFFMDGGGGGASFLGSPIQLMNPWSHAGISISAEQYGNDRYATIDVPFVYPLVVFSAVPLGLLLIRLRRAIRYRPGCCQNCGYDLRATPDRCPECGTVPPAPSGESAFVSVPHSGHRSGVERKS